jgi:hypothetical protein
VSAVPGAGQTRNVKKYIVSVTDDPQSWTTSVAVACPESAKSSCNATAAIFARSSKLYPSPSLSWPIDEKVHEEGGAGAGGSGVGCGGWEGVLSNTPWRETNCLANALAWMTTAAPNVHVCVFGCSCRMKG